MLKFIIFFNLFLLPSLFSSKRVHKHLQPMFFEKRGTFFLTKFFASPGFTSIFLNEKQHINRTLSNTLNETSSLTFVVLKAEDWSLFSDGECDKMKKKYAFYQEEILTNLVSHEYFERNFSLKQDVPQLYYFVLMDCSLKWSNMVHNLDLLPFVNLELIIKNSDGSHFGLEDQQLIFPCIVAIVLIFTFMIVNVRKIVGLYQKHEIIDYPLIITAIALSLEMIALGFQLINLLAYQDKGNYNFSMSFLQIFTENASNFLFTMIFICVAWGWSINYMNLASFDYFVPTLTVLGTANVILVVLNKILFENEEKPVVEGLSILNYIYLVYKLGFFLYFLKGVLKTYGIARNKIRNFVLKFLILGVAFFTSYGLLLLLSSLFSIHQRKKFLLIGNELINMVITIALLKVFNSKIYNELSFKGKDVLPSDNLPKYN